MSKMSVVDPRLKKFHKLMREVLALPDNQAKPDWRDESALALGAMLGKHVTRFTNACLAGDVAASLKASINIANYAFIFHDTATWMMTKASPAQARKILRASRRKAVARG